MNFTEEYVHFFTATILEWKMLLKPEKYKQIIFDSLKYLVVNNRIKLYGFVVMNNHIHIIWQSREGFTREENQQSFMKFTAQMILKDLRNNHPKVLEHFYVNLKDRKYQIWERNPLSIELLTQAVFEQKLEYIHQNLVNAGLCLLHEAYVYSSAKYYILNQDDWRILTSIFE